MRPQHRAPKGPSVRRMLRKLLRRGGGVAGRLIAKHIIVPIALNGRAEQRIGGDEQRDAGRGPIAGGAEGP